MTWEDTAGGSIVLALKMLIMICGRTQQVFWQDLKTNVAKASYSQLRLILGDGGEGLGHLTGIDLTQPADGRWRC